MTLIFLLMVYTSSQIQLIHGDCNTCIRNLQSIQKNCNLYILYHYQHDHVFSSLSTHLNSFKGTVMVQKNNSYVFMELLTSNKSIVILFRYSCRYKMSNKIFFLVEIQRIKDTTPDMHIWRWLHFTLRFVFPCQINFELLLNVR